MISMKELGESEEVHQFSSKQPEEWSYYVLKWSDCGKRECFRR